MSSRFAHDVATRADGPPDANERQKELIKFADKLTSSPQTFTPKDTDAIRRVLPDEGEVLEAATVVAGFNFANRVADALDVPLEVPRMFSRSSMVYRWTMKVMSLGIRMRMNFTNRKPLPSSPDEVLANLADSTAKAGMGRLPDYFAYLRGRPHILAGQAAICQSLLQETGIPRQTVQRIGYLISILNQDWQCANEFGQLLTKAGDCLVSIERVTQPAFRASTIEDEILVFARDITLCAHKITDAQVNSLKMQGVTERQLLNLVLVAASYNAGNRLNRALSNRSWSTRPPGLGLRRENQPLMSSWGCA